MAKTKPIQITSDMTVEQLKALKPKRAKAMAVYVKGRSKVMPASDIEFLQGINGEVTFS
jgi:hypothetical protein